MSADTTGAATAGAVPTRDESRFFMFDVFIREAGARFGLGDKALTVAQMLLADMTSPDTGGLMGFLERFKAAGLGPVIQSWLGGGPSAQPISNSQLETVLGASGGLLARVTGLLDANRDDVTTAIGYLLPAFVGRLTPGGSLPNAIPPEVLSLAAAGRELLTVPTAVPRVTTAAPGLLRWLPWAIVAAAAVIGLAYCGKQERASSSAPTAPAVESSAVPASVASAAPGAVEAASAPAAGGAASAAEPAAGVVSLTDAASRPALQVFFDSGASEVPGDLAPRAADLLAYLKANDTVKAVIFGFNDPTGDAAANAELSRRRAQAVQAALVAAGVAEDRTVLEKPADSAAAASSLAAARRVDVVLRP